MKNSFYSYYLDSPFVTGRVFDIFDVSPGTEAKETALFFVHGGGWRAGARVNYHTLMEAFSEKGYITGTTDYRLDAANAFEQLSDIRESFDCFVQWLIERGRPCRIAVHGSSAGAHLASLLCCALPGECGEDISRLKHPEIRPVSAILQATPYDFLPYDWRIPRFWDSMQNIAGVPYARDPEVYEKLSLKNYIREDNPVLFFMEAEFEHLFPIDLNLEITREHRKMNIPSQWKVYHHMEHGFFFELTRQMQIEAFEDSCKFLEGTLAAPLPPEQK